MKKLVTLVLLCCMMTSSLLSQQVNILNDETGQPAYITLKLPDTTYIHHFKDGIIPEDVTFDNKFMLSPRELFKRGSFDNSNSFTTQMDSIEPGILPEADLPYKVQYTDDGLRLVIIYHHTNNVVVYDAEDLSILADIKIGEGPEDLFVSNSRIYVSCYYSNDIYIISLGDYTIESSFEVEPHPSVIEVNDSEDVIYIGFDTGEHFKSRFLAAYGLSAHNKLWENNWAFIQQINMWEGFLGRKVYTISGFELIGNDQYIASLRNGGMIAIIMDALTGELVKTYYKTGENAFSMATTNSKDTLYIQSASMDSLISYCIDSYTHEVLDSISVEMVENFGFWHWQNDLAINNDGTKLFFEIGNLSTESYGYMVDFATHEYKFIQLGDYEDAIRQMIQSYDKQYVVLMGDRYRIFDFELEDYVYNQNYIFIENHKVIVSSPVSYNFVYCDFLANRDITDWKKNERINIYNFDDPTNIVKTDSIICGVQPEADFPYSAVLNNKHEKIITTNTLSGNISIIDANTYEVDTLLDIDQISSVKQVNEDQVLLAGTYSPYLLLFDIPSLSVVKQFDETGYYMIIPSPDPQYAYAFSRVDYRLLKIKLDGANSSIEDRLDITDQPAYYVNTEYRYWPEISPDGQYILFSNMPYITIVETESMQVVSEVNVSANWPIMDMAFTEDSKRVCFAYFSTKPYFDIIYLDGSNSFLENTITTEAGGGGMSVEFNPIDKKFYIARRENIWVVDPETAVVEDTLNLYVKDPQIQIGIDPQGNAIVNTLRYLYHDGVEYHMKESVGRFYVDYASQKCIIPSPGPDRVYILDFLTTEMHEIPVTKTDDHISVYPNPASDHLTVKSGKLIKRLQLYNNEGGLLFDKEYNNAVLTMGMSDYPEGVYFVKIYRDEKVVGKKVLVVR